MKKNKEQLRYLPAIISLSAGLIISIVMIINRKSFLLGFYIIGSLFRAVLIAMATKEADTKEDDSEAVTENVESEETDKEDKEE